VRNGTPDGLQRSVPLGAQGHTIHYFTRANYQVQSARVSADSIDEKAMVPLARFGGSRATNETPSTCSGSSSFLKLPSVEDVISERIIFEVGGTRFAIKWNRGDRAVAGGGTGRPRVEAAAELDRSPQVRR
jgi:hypothetical protein